jgi:hypothetical protein
MRKITNFLRTCAWAQNTDSPTQANLSHNSTDYVVYNKASLLIELKSSNHDLVRLSISAESAVIQQCFSLTTNQRTVLSATANQRNEQAACLSQENEKLAKQASVYN